MKPLVLAARPARHYSLLSLGLPVRLAGVALLTLLLWGVVRWALA